MFHLQGTFLYSLNIKKAFSASNIKNILRNTVWQNIFNKCYVHTIKKCNCNFGKIFGNCESQKISNNTLFRPGFLELLQNSPQSKNQPITLKLLKFFQTKFASFYFEFRILVCLSILASLSKMYLILSWMIFEY